ncbi:class-I aminoacyl-tRNA synthetase [Dermatophagoides farinae]|uniref:leucine--tRNA ligase n=1 Tax=Dermatophagoides farinae TaxID=6954 RepID=A0A922L1C1_DERFA|nr:hypothetical protein HUG17_5910 [Dermatophagoides farinae]KAH9506392.1 class-I aminoacyl-tRNA synthetase [Dermatophagoides farinae]
MIISLLGPLTFRIKLIAPYRSCATITTIFSEPNKFKSKFDYSYVPAVLRDIENKWKNKVDGYWNNVVSKQQTTSDTKYVLSMFPYPSGQLHLGHTRIYTTADLLFKTSFLCGENVVNPMGFDSFGLPAENAARINNQDPFVWTNSNMKQMKSQLKNLGYHFHWRESTSDPSYYRWTQWLFLELFKSGLAYQGISQVNWDPIDCTVLADEQVDSDGKSWRSGAIVEKRFHKQWFIKTNAFAEDLYAGDDIIDTGHWSFILAHQRWWIQKPNGYLFYLTMSENDKSGLDNILQIFTPYPELFCTPKAFIGISKQHWLSYGKKPGEIVGQIRNPFLKSNEKIDIRLIDDENFPPSTQATLFTARETHPDETKRSEVLNRASSLGLGGYYTSRSYRDWLISRQRFWGTPIPIVHCKNCGPVPVDDQDLPIQLPHIDYSKISSFTSTDISSPLKNFAPNDWLSVECPKCKTDAIRETDTCDTFFDSSWYFLRYFTKPSDRKPFDKIRLRPVDCYIGGKEHSALHLFYARFITHFLQSKGYLEFREPFHTLLMQAIVKARTYKLNGKYITAMEAEDRKDVEVTFEKMSKSKGTGIDPDLLVQQYSSDAVRWTILSVGNPESERLWDSEEKEFGPTFVFFHRILLTIEEYLAVKCGQLKTKPLDAGKYDEIIKDFSKQTDHHIFNVLYSICSSYQIRNGTSTIHKLINLLRANIRNDIVHTKEYERALASLIIMLSPFVPCFASECWQAFTSQLKANEYCKSYGFDYSKNVVEQKWPKIIDSNFMYIVRFTCRNENGREEEKKRIKIPLKLLQSWSVNEIRNLFKSIDEHIEWIEIVKNCSIVIRLKNQSIDIPPIRDEFVDA